MKSLNLYLEGKLTREDLEKIVSFKEIVLAASRYEKIRRFNPREFSDLWKTALWSSRGFDAELDDNPLTNGDSVV